MASDIGSRPKVAARVDLTRSPPTMPAPTARSSVLGLRSPSPTRSAFSPVPRPKAKVSSSATPGGASATRVERASSTSSHLSAGPAASRSPPPPRAPSPFKSRGANGAAPAPVSSGAPSQIKARVTIRTSSEDPTKARSVAAAPGLRIRPSSALLGAPGVVQGRKRVDSLSLAAPPAAAAAEASSLSSLRTPVGRPANLPSPGVSPGVSPSVGPGAGSAGPPRVTAKLSTSMRKAMHASSPSAGSSPLPPAGSNELTSRPGGSLRVRTPSMVSRTGLPSFDAPSPLAASLSLPGTAAPSPPFVYPITMGNPAANPHRYASPSPRHAFPGAFGAPSPASSLGTSPADRTSSPAPRIPPSLTRVDPRVDPRAVPLPPTSPPGSTVSFSSQSSASSWAPARTPSGATSPPLPLVARVQGRRSVSGMSSPTVDGPGAGTAGLLMSMIDAPTPTTPNAGDADREDGSIELSGSELGTKAEDKSKRKIADLEISNRSLLTINSSLEQTKHRQSREIRDLRRKLRESKLVLPPRAYRLMREREREEGVSQDEPDEEEDDEGTEDSDADVEEPAAARAHDEGYFRVCALVDGLLASARAALADTPASVLARDRGGGGARVLSADELHSWHADGVGGLSPGPHPGDLSIISEAPSSIFGDDDEHTDADASYASFASGADASVTRSEDEVERSLLFDFDGSGAGLHPHFMPRAHSPTPPIIVSVP